MTEDLFTPKHYWEQRYRLGRSSGAGSEGAEGRYKADYLSQFCAEHDITSVIDWGCGDGQVLELARFPEGIKYVGVDVSPTIVQRMTEKFTSPYSFFTAAEYLESIGQLDKRMQADTPHKINRHPLQFTLALSMDVLFHLPSDEDYHEYLSCLFGSASQFVVIYSTNYAGGRTDRHVYRRGFTPDIADRFPEWKLTTVESPLREGLASFFVYEKVDA